MRIYLIRCSTWSDTDAERLTALAIAEIVRDRNQCAPVKEAQKTEPSPAPRPSR
jgi:hypothetical protein